MERSGRIWEVNSCTRWWIGWAGAEGGVGTDFWCLACITAWMVVPFTEIRDLEEDQVWEGRWRVWFVQAVNTFVTVIDERSTFLS